MAASDHTPKLFQMSGFFTNQTKKKTKTKHIFRKIIFKSMFKLNARNVRGISVFLSNMIPRQSDVFFFTANHLVWPRPLPGHQGTAWRCHVLHSRPPVVLFCTCNIYRMSVRLRRGDPPLWLFLRFLFFPVKRVFFLTWNESLRTEDVLYCTDCKAHWGNVIVILGYMNKTDLNWLSAP